MLLLFFIHSNDMTNNLTNTRHYRHKCRRQHDQLCGTFL